MVIRCFELVIDMYRYFYCFNMYMLCIKFCYYLQDEKIYFVMYSFQIVYFVFREELK